MRARFLVAYVLIIAIAFTVVGVSLLQLVGDHLFEQTVKEDGRTVQNLSDDITNAFFMDDAEALYAAVLQLCPNPTDRVIIVDEYGVVCVDSHSELNGRRLANKQVVNILNGSLADYGLYENEVASGGLLLRFFSMLTYGQSMTGVFAHAITAANRTAGAVLYVTNIGEVYRSLGAIRFKIILWLVIIGVVVLLITVFLIRAMTRPIENIKSSIARMTAGDLSSRITVRGKDEFAELATAFNSMSEHLEQIDKTRGQFVSNASHELKTPLSTMKILIESLLYQDPPDPALTKEFLGDVNKEIDRLNRIVTDLLTLANIDSGSMTLNRQPLDLGDLLIEQVKRLGPLARENGIELDCDKDKTESIIVNGDALKLQQVLYNVIDNAIKYTPRGGEVTCSIDYVKSTGRAVVAISDTGIGIPEADLAHVFDRFYRVDKARSRATGGTGLGLSIVRQIVQLHGGTIVAKSKEEKGSTFVIELPATIPEKAKE